MMKDIHIACREGKCVGIRGKGREGEVGRLTGKNAWPPPHHLLPRQPPPRLCREGENLPLCATMCEKASLETAYHHWTNSILGIGRHASVTPTATESVSPSTRK